jgi:hypothetical protein
VKGWRLSCTISVDGLFTDGRFIGLRWVYALRTGSDNTVEILIDPWTDKSAIWTLDIKMLQVKKVRDFGEYKEREYTDEVVW